VDVTISVVIPVRNRPDQVVAAIDSLLAQGRPDVELIVVDDGSDDATPAAVETRVGYGVRLITQPHQGVSVARNTGVSECSFDFVTFLDSDDTSAPGALDFFARTRTELGAEISSGAVRLRRPDGSVEQLPPRPLGPAFGDLDARFLSGAFAIDRDLYTEVGGFTPGLSYSEHTDLGLRLGGVATKRHIRCATTTETVVRVENRSTERRPALLMESALTILRLEEQHLERSPELHATYLAIAGVNASKLGDRRLATSLLARAVRTRPLDARNWLRLMRATVAV
jgi:glycosyltransferase involved in cell wall biosynthesis